MEHRRRSPGSQDVGSSPSDDTLDLWAAARVVWESRYIIITGTFSCALVAYALSFLQPRHYQATATVFITPPILTNELQPAPMSIESYSQLAASAFVQSRVVEQLRRDRVIGPDEAIGALTTSLYPSREPQKPFLPLIGLTADASTPEKAATAANVWMQVFIDEQRGLAAAGKSGSVDFVLAEFPKASERLGERQETMREVQNRHARTASELAARLSLDLKRARLLAREEHAVELEKQLYQTRLDIGVSQRTLAEVEREIARTPEHLTTSKAITDDALWQTVVRGSGDQGGASLPAELAANRLESRETNPVYTALAQRLATERVRYNTLVPSEQALRDQIEQTRGLAAQLRNELSAGQLQLANLQREQGVELAIYQRQLDEAQERFNKLQDKIGNAQIAKAEQNSNLKVGALAEPPGGPLSPNVPLNVAAAAALGFLASLVAAWVVLHLRQDLTVSALEGSSALAGVGQSTVGRSA